MNDIDKILMASGKADLLEELSRALETTDSIVVVMLRDNATAEVTLSLGFSNNFEVLGALDLAAHYLKNDILLSDDEEDTADA